MKKVITSPDLSADRQVEMKIPLAQRVNCNGPQDQSLLPVKMLCS